MSTRKIISIFLTALLIFTIILIPFKQGKVFAATITDDFSSTTLDSAWNWVREDNTKWSLSARSGYMRIQTTGTELWETQNDAKNLLLRLPGSSDWIISTKLDYVPDTNYQQAGLIAYQDDNNYVRLMSRYENSRCIEIEKEIGGSGTYNSVSANLNTIYLKMEKAGNTYTCYYSSNGNDWIQAYQYTGVSLGNIRVGLGVFGTSGKNADFDWLNIEQTEPAVVIDDFSSSTLDSAWSWIREDNTKWSLSARSGYMRIQTTGTELWETQNDAKNLLLRTPDTSDWTISTKLEFTPDTNYQQAGLVAYQDDNNYVRVMSRYGNDRYVEIEKEIGGSGIYNSVSVNLNTIYLKMEKAGNTFTCYYSGDGNDWILAYQYTGVNLSNIRFGLGVFGTSGKNADFDWLRIEQVETGAAIDNFANTALDGAWSWIRQDNTKWSLSARRGYMRIQTTNTELWETQNDAKNLLLRTPGTSDWTISTKLDFTPGTNFQQAGLIAYQDDNNYMRLLSRYGDGRCVEIEKEIGGVGTYKMLPTSLNTIYLKMEKTGNTFTCYYSSNGIDWIQAYRYTGVNLSNIKVGLGVFGASGQNADFDWFKLGPGVQFVPIQMPENAPRWNLNTDDTNLTLAVWNNKIYIETLKNPDQNWNWINVITEMPLVNYINGQVPDWTYQDAAVDNSNGTKVTLRFTSTVPNLELKSIWYVRPGVGPVENQVNIKNNTGSSIVVYGNNVFTADLHLISDSTVTLTRSQKDVTLGGPVMYSDVIGQNSYVQSNHTMGYDNQMPYEILQAGTTHGLYLGYDYDYGTFDVSTANNPLAINCRFAPENVNTTIANNEIFRCPGIFIETYKGDEDTGSNNFKKWFWNYEITPSLRNNSNEPWVAICNAPAEDGNINVLLNQATYLASWGAEYLKTDAWYMEAGHTRSDELAAACHNNGLKLGLYWCGPQTEATIRNEFDFSNYDVYRTDQYYAPTPYEANNYHSFMDFNQKIDNMIAYGAPNWRYENCCNGGQIKTFDVMRRMMVMTGNDDPTNILPHFKTIYSCSYMMNPIQIRSDYGYVGQGMAAARGLLLGAPLLGANASTQAEIDMNIYIANLYKTKQRPILRGGDTYHILPLPSSNEWFGMQYFNTSLNKGLVLLWQNGGAASKVIKLKGLDSSASYTLTFEDGTSQNCTKTGAELMNTGINVTIGVNASEIIWIN